MYVDTSKSKRPDGKVQVRHLLRESHRVNGNVVKKTIANISHLSDSEVEALRLALRHKDELAELGIISRDVSTVQGLSIGGIITLQEVAEKLGITASLGRDTNGKLALWQIMARVIEQGSRLSATRLGLRHSIDQLLDIEGFNEDKLYANLKWLSTKQSSIEDALFRFRYKGKKPSLYLYDVTSSYLEGTENAFGAFGYNRDGKKGKKQIVIGLLCDAEGWPLSIEVFPGNTQDTTTMASQIKKATERFGGGEVTFVGDRGMIKSTQIKDILDNNFHYITAITKAQIETLLKENVIQLGLFDTELSEVVEDNVRYILRRNPVRAQEVKDVRNAKIVRVLGLIKDRNTYLLEHLKAKTETAIQKVNNYIKKLKIEEYVNVSVVERELIIAIDEETLAEIAKLDGCYVIKTDLKVEQVKKEIIYKRYKDLALVEKAFRYCKTEELELRPIFVRKEESTRAHAFIVMLSYCIIRYLREAWQEIDTTVQEGINTLSQLCLIDVLVKDEYAFTSVPKPRDDIKELLNACNISLPKAIKLNKTNVSTKVKLNNMRHLANNKRVKSDFVT